MSHETFDNTALERCERFIRIFVDCERSIKKLLPVNERKGDFQDLAFRYSQIRPGLPELSDAKRIKSIFELLKRERDLLAHTGWTHPAMVPSEEVMASLEELHRAITNPITAYEAFVNGKGEVVQVSLGWTLEKVLGVIGSNDFSQFPIVENGTFHGLITEQSITRFLAKLVVEGKTKLDFRQLTVEQARVPDGDCETYRFVKASTPIDAVERLFHSILNLEVLFISENGVSTDDILGIATAWDIARLHKQKDLKSSKVG